MDSTLIDLIKVYYDRRGFKWPSFSDAMKFVHTELGEVYELDLDRIGGFIRNHPETKPKFNKDDLAEELGDAIFMLMVAGIVEGVDPLEAMVNKITQKLDEQKREVRWGPNGMTYGQSIPENMKIVILPDGNKAATETSFTEEEILSWYKNSDKISEEHLKFLDDLESQFKNSDK